MLRFPATSVDQRDLRFLPEGCCSPWAWGGAHSLIRDSKSGNSLCMRGRRGVRAADSEFGRTVVGDIAHRGRGFAKHVADQVWGWRWRSPNLQKLPVYFHEEGQELQYAWDGQSLRIVPVEQKVEDGAAGQGSQLFRTNLGKIRRALDRTFVPELVRPHYLSYMRWKFLHRLLSSVIQVQCTQAMLQAIGVGARRALPAAAGLNWVLKDGLGRLGRLAYSGSLGSTFDSNLKRVRFSTSVLFSVSLGLEMLTPYFPGYFLVLATIANVGRSIALAAYLATSSAIHKSFALGDNLADIAAKGQVQTVVADNSGLALACALSAVVRANRRLEPLLLLAVIPCLTALDLFAIYRELQSVHLQTLNRERLEIIVEKWITETRVPSTKEVSYVECSHLIHLFGRKSLPLRIGALKANGWRPEDMLPVFRSQAEQQYVIFLEASGPIPLFHPEGLLLWLKDGFSPKDVITGALQVGYMRAMAFSEETSHLIQDHRGQRVPDRSKTIELHTFYKYSQDSWCSLVVKSRKQAEANIGPLLAAMEDTGWETKHLLLDPHERQGYRIHLDE